MNSATLNAVTFRHGRDIGLFLLGAGGFIHEVVATGTERPTILLGCLALLGVPVFLRKDDAAVSAVPAAPAAPAGPVNPAGPVGPEGPEGT